MAPIITTVTATITTTITTTITAHPATITTSGVAGGEADKISGQDGPVKFDIVGSTPSIVAIAFGVATAVVFGVAGVYFARWWVGESGRKLFGGPTNQDLELQKIEAGLTTGRDQPAASDVRSRQPSGSKQKGNEEEKWEEEAKAEERMDKGKAPEK